MAEVGLQQQVGFGVGAVKGVCVDLQWELLSQLAVELVLVVPDRQFGILLCILTEEDPSQTGSQSAFSVTSVC